MDRKYEKKRNERRLCGNMEQEKGAVENEKVVVYKNIKYSIKIYRTD